MRKFNIGDRVKYVSGQYEDYKNNPLWGGVCGHVIGTVCDVYGRTGFDVDWDNGTHNGYEGEDLEYARERIDVSLDEGLFVI